MKSIYRQIGLGCQLLFHRVLQDTLDLSPPDATWSYTVPTAKDARVFHGDSRDLPAALPAGAGDYTAVITSPPYPNRMSYIRELRPYMYWLGFTPSRQVRSPHDEIALETCSAGRATQRRLPRAGSVTTM